MKSIPNILSVLRILLAPVLVCLAWFGHKNYFLIVLVMGLLTDALDGYLARKLNATSETGAKLDSIGDLCMYVILPLCAWWLWPEIIKKEAPYVVIAVSAYFLPLGAGLLKFHQIPCYHTYGAKAAAIIMTPALLLLFMTDFNVVFRIAAVFQAVVALEEIAITLRLSELKSDVKSVWHLSRKRSAT
jgi:CDP-diacylglycerol--glycerol-3-phosphate 3-phosphatidyltransferase